MKQCIEVQGKATAFSLAGRKDMDKKYINHKRDQNCPSYGWVLPIPENVPEEEKKEFFKALNEYFINSQNNNKKGGLNHEQ